MQTPPTLILATQSSYKIGLFQRLNLPFTSVVPNVDESPLQDESPLALAKRLAQAKAEKILTLKEAYRQSWVLACDQAAICNHQLLNKPGTHTKAIEQLKKLSGQCIVFYTAICLYNPNSQVSSSACTKTDVKMRALSETDIQHYLSMEPAYDCVGSCKSEGLGITLCEYVRSDDPTALVGLPLIATTQLLKNMGYFNSNEGPFT